MFHECESGLLSLLRLTAPTRHVRHPAKGQCHRRGQFYPTVQSAACSELLTPSERDRPEENASCCDPDKGPRERQVHPPSSGNCQTTANGWSVMFACSCLRKSPTRLTNRSFMLT